MGRLIELIKEKLEISYSRDPIKMHMSIRKTVQEFGVSEYKIKCVR